MNYNDVLSDGQFAKLESSVIQFVAKTNREIADRILRMGASLYLVLQEFLKATPEKPDAKDGGLSQFRKWLKDHEQDLDGTAPTLLKYVDLFTYFKPFVEDAGFQASDYRKTWIRDSGPNADKILQVILLCNESLLLDISQEIDHSRFSEFAEDLRGRRKGWRLKGIHRTFQATQVKKDLKPKVRPRKGQKPVPQSEVKDAQSENPENPVKATKARTVLNSMKSTLETMRNYRATVAENEDLTKQKLVDHNDKREARKLLEDLKTEVQSWSDLMDVQLADKAAKVIKRKAA